MDLIKRLEKDVADLKAVSAEIVSVVQRLSKLEEWRGAAMQVREQLLERFKKVEEGIEKLDETLHTLIVDKPLNDLTRRIIFSLAAILLMGIVGAILKVVLLSS